MATGSDESLDRALRHRALRGMRAAHGPDGDRVLARHPEFDEVSRDPAPEEEPDGDAPIEESLADLLWDELEVLERRRMRLVENSTPAARRTSVGFFLRRRRLARYTGLRAAAGRLPALWVRIMRMDPDQLGRAGYQLGIRLLGAALARLDPDERAATWRSLTALQHKALTRAVREKAIPKHDASLAELWLAAYRFAREHRGEKRAVEILGRLLLGTLFRRVPPGLQDEVLRHSKTTFCSRLLELPTLEFASDADETIAGELATRVVERFSPSLERGDDDGPGPAVR